ncbi:helix-turn-helix transcriptional regulator [Vibrio phage VP9]|uniref:Helix-turn-helix transcriptional regulator n=1 Tax=Vibrio phage VP9 TaxID=3025410 RepID=A0AAF0CKH8_9CAUD|nr:helix-turn-helix transcriptional regulator [Vibrio phage VP9]
MALNAKEIQFLRENYGDVGQCLSKKGAADVLGKTYNEISHAIRYNGIKGNAKRSGSKLNAESKRKLIKMKQKGVSSQVIADMLDITPQHVNRVYAAHNHTPY